MYDPQVIYEALITTGNDWADKKHAFNQLDNLTKSVLAKAFRAAPDGSAAQKEKVALDSKEYRDHIFDVSEAHREFLFSQVKYESTKALADGRRTEASTRRAEVKFNSNQT